MSTVRNKNGIEFDVDALVTDVNGKVDKDLVNCTVPYVMNRTPNNQGGIVEIWSDGYCVQTGIVQSGSTSVAFPMEFKDTNYYFNANLTNGGDLTTLHIVSSNYSTTGCSLKEGQYNTNPRALTAAAKWRAEGYIR